MSRVRYELRMLERHFDSSRRVVCDDAFGNPRSKSLIPPSKVDIVTYHNGPKLWGLMEPPIGVEPTTFRLRIGIIP